MLANTVEICKLSYARFETQKIRSLCCKKDSGPRNGTPQQYQITWDNLKPTGCETTPNCTNTSNITGGGLEDQSENLYYSAPYKCFSNLPETVGTEVLFPSGDQGVRPCNEFAVINQPDPNNPIPNIAVPVRFNPVVLTKLALPNGQAYEFKYNRYGEISKIIYPTGSSETFVYDSIRETGGFSTSAHAQTNRGVVERKVYDANGTLEQRWTYTPTIAGTVLDPSIKITTTRSRSDNVAAPGMRTETLIYERKGDLFGYSDPLAGMPYDERTFDENGDLRTRVLTEYVTKDIPTARVGLTAKRDPRVERKLSITFEPDKPNALATLSETTYDDEENPNARDDEYLSDFRHLNVKTQKTSHFVSKPASTVDDETLAWSTIASWFAGREPASIIENDYVYDANYKARGITSLPFETRSIDPANLGNVLARSQTIYDNQIPMSLETYPGEYSVLNYGFGVSMDCSATQQQMVQQPPPPLASAGCWVDPSSAYFGRRTTTRVWNKDNDTWIESHARYDQFGNAVAARDPIGNETKTTFSSNYGYIYPTKVIAPAPNVGSSNHGTSETSTVETAYDFNTGLPIAVKDDFGQITTTEYDDPLLRPTKVSPIVVNGVATGPITTTEYYDGPTDTSTGNALGGSPYVRVKKQIDAENWDVATTYMDSFGRAIKTVAKDSQGDVIVETKYDLLGRVTMVSNPYRAGETILWNLTEYDAVGRVKQTREPTANQNPSNPSGNILGKTDYDISSETGFVGTVVTTEDASGRKGRSVTNALGQLLRVDEPDSEGNLPALPQATGNPSPEPTEPTCVDNCFVSSGNAYDSHSTFYKYDAYGKMVKVTQGEQEQKQERFFKYDSLGRLIRVRQPEQEVNASLDLNDPTTDNNQWTAGFTYDVLGNVLTATDANGTVITNTYDRAGRVLTRSYNDATTSGLVGTTPSVNFYYDGKGLAQQQSPNYAKGKLTKVSNSVSETLYSQFDNFGRVTESKQITDGQIYASSYVYNLSGALIEEHYPSGRVVKNEFESDGDLARISSKKNLGSVYTPFATGFSYTADGKIKQLKLGNNLWESALFNNRLQVTELNLGHSVVNNPGDAGGHLWKLGYEYGELDENGEVLPATNTGNIGKQTLSVPGVTFVQRYKYDSLYRLTSAKETAEETETWSHTFSYDRFGNRTFFEELINGIRSTRTAPAINANTNRFSSSEFTYDKNGNITRDKDAVTSQERTFVFNGDNKQAEIRDVNGILIGKYYYDGEGKRVKKFIFATNETTVFAYSSGKLVAEYSTALPTANPSINYTATDMLGSPRVITNQLGNVVSRRDFMPFGEDVPTEAGDRANVEDQLEVAIVEGNGNLRTTALNYQSTDAIRQRFTGYQKDTETSLDFAEARMYESRYGRFTAVDPLLASGKSSNPQTFNRFAYVGNNPIARIDPDGREWIYLIETHTVKQMEKFRGRTRTVERKVDVRVATWVPNGEADSRIERAPGVLEVTYGEKGFYALNPNKNEHSELFKTRQEAQTAYNEMVRGTEESPIQAFVNSIAENAEIKARTVRMSATAAGVTGACIGTAGAGCAGAIKFGTAVIEAEMDAANASAADAVSTDVHGNDLSSPRLTWVYELWKKGADGEFLKNGITSQEKPENRYTKGYMEDKEMRVKDLYGNRRQARDVERERNRVNKGPLNKRR